MVFCRNLLLAGALLSGCHRSASDLATVSLRTTPVRNQGQNGFCTLYAVAGLAETLAATRADRRVNVSEEAIGFFGIAEGVLNAAQGGYGVENIVLDSFPMPYAIELMGRYGLVPESAWSVKFAPGEFDAMQAVVAQRLEGFMRGRDPASVTLADIVDYVLVGEGAFPSAPPSSFSFAGASWEPQSFMREYLTLRPEDYATRYFVAPSEYPELVTQAKRALASGSPALMSIGVVRAVTGSDADWGTDGLDFSDRNAVVTSSGHVLLITDFVNEGGHAGGMSEPDIVRELARPVEEFSHFVFKNSWGFGMTGDKPELDTGYFTIDKDYLRGMLSRNPPWELPDSIGLAVPQGEGIAAEVVESRTHLAQEDVAGDMLHRVVAPLVCRDRPDGSEVGTLPAWTTVVLERIVAGAQEPWVQVRAGELICHVPARRADFVRRTVPRMHCRGEFSQHRLVGSFGGQYCASAAAEVGGPFSTALIERCRDLAPEETCTRNAWPENLFLQVRGTRFCPLNARLDVETGFCEAEGFVYGPFSDEAVQACLARGHGAVVCSAARWPVRVAHGVIAAL